VESNFLACKKSGSVIKKHDKLGFEEQISRASLPHNGAAHRLVMPAARHFPGMESAQRSPGRLPRSPLFHGKLRSSPDRHGYSFELTLRPCAAAAEALNTEICTL